MNTKWKNAEGKLTGTAKAAIIGGTVVVLAIASISGVAAGNTPATTPSAATHTTATSTTTPKEVTPVTPAPPAKTTVPDLTGMDGGAAQTALTAAHLEGDLVADSGVVLLPSNWQVTAQSVPPNTSVDVDTKVTVSMTKPKTTVTLSGSSGAAYTWNDASGMHQTTSNGAPFSFTLDSDATINANVVDLMGKNATCKAVSGLGKVLVENAVPGQTMALCTY